MSRLERLLKENEWSRPSPSLRDKQYPFGVPTCPICLTPQARGGHNLECWLGQVIDEASKRTEQLKVHREVGDDAEKEVLQLQTKVSELQTELEGRTDELNEAIYQLQLALDTLRQRTFDTLKWMVPDMKHRHNQTHDNVEPGSQGGYSDELNAAIVLFNELGGI